MKRKSKFIMFIGVSVILSSCSEFQEPQIDQESIEIIIPRDSLRTDIASQQFYWYEIEGAITYELQIVSPSFNQIDRLSVDTSLTTNKFNTTLSPGEYQWRLRAYNNSSSTDFVVHTLIIDSTIDLSGQTINTTSPANKDTSNTFFKLFRWQSLYNADHYHVEIWTPDIGGSLIYSADTSLNLLGYTIPYEGAYTWRVRGENTYGSMTSYSSGSFYVDTARPQIISLDNPGNGTILNRLDLELSWTRDNNSGSSRTDFVYLSQSPNFSNPMILPVRYTSIGIDTLSAGQYYWQVRSSDKAGNTGNFSSTGNFVLQ